jgi:hypothetical protein
MGLGSSCPKIGERQGRLGREGNSGSDCWGLRQWQFGLVAWVSERGWLGLDEGCRVERREGRKDKRLPHPQCIFFFSEMLKGTTYT